MDMKEPEQCDYLTKLLNIHLVFREIVKYLALQDLISCSGVNREWCVMFREYIWEFRQCNIHLVWLDRPCQQLKKLNQLLMNSTFPLPFNGVCVSDWQMGSVEFWSVWPTYSCPAENHENFLSDCYDTFLAKLRFTSCDIFLPERKKRVEDHTCPAIRCMKNIVILNADKLKSLTLRESPEVDSLLDYFEVDQSLRPVWLGKLERLYLGSCYTSRQMVHAEEILEASPNLKAIIGKFLRSMIIGGAPRNHQAYNGYTGIIPTNKYNCIKKAYGLTPSQLLRVAKEKPQLEYLSLYSRWQGYSFKLFEDDDYTNQRIAVEALNILFRTSLNSLRVIMGDIFHLGVLSREVDKGSWPLMNVSRLDLFSTCEELSYFNHINFPFMFPNLSHVSIWVKTSTSNLDPNLLSSESDFDHAGSAVKNLHLYGYIPEEYLKSLESAFPNLTDFTYHDCKEVKEICEALWKMNWGEMTRIKFCSIPINLDIEDVFFGVPQGEREFIESQGGLDGSNYHHVSSKYSALNLQSLKTIQLELKGCISRELVSTGTKLQIVPFPFSDIQTSPLVSLITAQKISKGFPGLEMEIIIKRQEPPNGMPNCENANPRLLKHPERLSAVCPCLRKYWTHHKQGWAKPEKLKVRSF